MLRLEGNEVEVFADCLVCSHAGPREYKGMSAIKKVVSSYWIRLNHKLTFS